MKAIQHFMFTPINDPIQSLDSGKGNFNLRPSLTIANSLDPNQDRQNAGPDLNPKCLTL